MAPYTPPTPEPDMDMEFRRSAGLAEEPQGSELPALPRPRTLESRSAMMWLQQQEFEWSDEVSDHDFFQDAMEDSIDNESFYSLGSGSGGTLSSGESG